MWLVDNYKLFFLRVPKTGSHTIYRTFNGGIGYKGMHGTMGRVYKNDKNLYNEIVNTYQKYAVVRNPWSHAVSRYFHDIDCKRFNFNRQKTEEYKSFDDYISNKKYEAQEQTSFNDDKLIIDKWLRFENLSEELENICINNSIKYVKYELNKNKERENIFNYDYPSDYREMYKSDKTIEMVQNLSKNEIKKFNYKFNGI